jgi:hypothetical protein
MSGVSTVFRPEQHCPMWKHLVGADGVNPVSGAAQVDFGLDDYGVDVKVFGATSGSYMLYDESADKFSVVMAARAITGEEHAASIAMGGTLSSGDSMVGLNIAVTTAGTAGQWVSALYAKVVQGATKNVNGYLCAAEFEVTNSADNISAWFVMVLNAGNSGSTSGSNSAYVALREYGSTPVPNLFWFAENAIGTKSDTSLLTTFADGAHISHAIRCSTGNQVPLWILCSTQVPSGT